MTLPQIYMLGHAAWVNSERMDARIKAKSAKREDAPKQDSHDVSSMTSDEWQRYYQF